MVLFATPWEYSFYSWGEAIDIVLWIAAIVSAVFALLLLASYINTRKTEHLYWGISFALLWINTHLGITYVVVNVRTMSVERVAGFWTFLDPVNATFFALTVGLFAVGLWKNVKPEKDKIGNYLLMYVVAMSLAIGFFKNENMIIVLGTPSYLVPILVMALHVPSAILIIWLPLQTREENGKSALAFPIAGVLMSIIGILLAGATLVEMAAPLEEGYLFITLAAFPFIYLLAVMFFAWGTFVPKRWGFSIAGIELED
jgi:hypothetical protein